MPPDRNPPARGIFAIARLLIFLLLPGYTNPVAASDPGDEAWAGGFNAPGVQAVMTKVRAMEKYQGSLYVAGDFWRAGAATANRVVRWDGSTWSALGTGVTNRDPPGFVYVFALAVYDGGLVVGGYFTDAGGSPANAIARWDGRSWSPLGLGVLGGFVTAMTVHEGKLIVAGDFRVAGAVPVHGLACWDGHAWSSLAADFSTVSGYEGTLDALLSHGGSLYVAGSFSRVNGIPARNIARWDGRFWSAVGQGTNGEVTSLASFDAQLVAGGCFSVAGDQEVPFVARWDGMAWSGFGSGIPNDCGQVDVLLECGNQLYAGGRFYDFVHRNQPPRRQSALYRWDGIWTPLPFTLEGDWAEIHALAAFGGVLYAGGDFERVLDRLASGLAVWDGSTWMPGAPGNGLASRSASEYSWEANEVRAFAAYGDKLVAAGRFQYAGSRRIQSIASWDGRAWQPLGSGIEGEVRVLALYEGTLVAAGDFDAAGGVPAHDVARWDGVSWSPLGDGLTQGAVNALAVHDGQLVAGGTFNRSGARFVFDVARWDGRSWSPMAYGLFYGVSSLAVYRGSLVAGGDFTWDGKKSVRGVARWDGSSWQQLGNGLSGSVMALVLHNSGLVAGGSFAGGVECWDGIRWRAVGLGMSGNVAALTVHQGELVAGGGFGLADGRPASCIARWDGAAWSALGSGADYGVGALASFDRDLWVGGYFWTAGGKPSMRIARWTGRPLPSRTPPESSGAEPRDPAAPGEALLVRGIAPGSGCVTIRFAVPNGAEADLTIFDVRGRIVRRLVSAFGEPGEHDVTWDRNTEQGVRAPAGLYFVRLVAGPMHATRKLVLLPGAP